MILLLSCALLQEASVARDRVPEVRRAIERSLPWLEKGGVDWIREKKCSSCHEVTFMLWSHREALGRGFAVEAAKLDEWSRWAVEFSRTTKTKEGERGGGLETMAQLLLGRGSTGTEPWTDDLVGPILALQKPEGFWKAGGQLPDQRRPKEETNEASTRWVLLALQTLGPEDEARKSAREKAETWLAGRKPGKSTEPLALSVLMTRSEELRKELLARQNEDGGWAFLSGEASDALTTGQVLYVLSDPGMKGDPRAIARAREFLVRTQGDDGSWKVPSTKAKAKNDLMSSYWGTGWAAIGLLRSLPR
jgi:hypothetical protein